MTLFQKQILLKKIQIKYLDFTREVKNSPESDKIKIIESLWKIIYSNNEC